MVHNRNRYIREIVFQTREWNIKYSLSLSSRRPLCCYVSLRHTLNIIQYVDGFVVFCFNLIHDSDVIVSAVSVTGVSIVCWIFCSGADQRKHQSSASLAFVRGTHRSPHKGRVTRKMFPFDDAIMSLNFLGELSTFAELCILSHFIPLGCFVWLPQCQWRNTEQYGNITLYH